MVGEVGGLEIHAASTGRESVIIPLGSAATYQAHERITLNNVTFFYRHQSGRGSILARGRYDLCETPFDLTVEKLGDGTVKVGGDSQAPIDVETIERALAIEQLGVVFGAVRRSSLWEARLLRPSMEAYIGEDYSAKFSGDSYLGQDAHRVHLEFGCRKLRDCDVTAGVTSDELSLQNLVGIFVAFDYLPSLTIFTQDPRNSRVSHSELCSASTSALTTASSAPRRKTRPRILL